MLKVILTFHDKKNVKHVKQSKIEGHKLPISDIH